MKAGALLAFLFLSVLFFPFSGLPAGDDVRDPILAGAWYPAGPEELSSQIRGFLERADVPSLEGRLQAVIVPHAGIVYSGPVAAFAYRLLQGREIDRVILVGPSHRHPFRGCSVNLQSAYKTPLGAVPVDRAFGRALIEACPEVGWVPRAHAVEHCLEIQLPFLQSVLRDFRIVPIVMGDQAPGTCSSLAESLVSLLGQGEGTLLLASTDLSHFHNAESAERLDRECIRHIRNSDPDGLFQALRKGDCEACGGGPAVAVMRTSARLGAQRTRILAYAHSGQVTGDNNRVVGYVSAALLGDQGEGEENGMGE